MMGNTLVNNTTSIHTKEKILTKLDSDLTDSERKNFLIILCESLDTLDLLTTVAIEWRQALLKNQIEIEKLKETIRMKDIYIDNCKTFLPSQEMEEKIEYMQKSLDANSSNLENMKSTYQISIARATKSLLLMDSILDKSIEDEQNTKNNIHHYSNMS